MADLVRGQKPAQALTTLRFANKAAALPLAKAIQTALANTRMRGLDEEKVIFKVLEVNEGPKMKRSRAGSRGHANPYKRRMSHIKIVLSDEKGER